MLFRSPLRTRTITSPSLLHSTAKDSLLLILSKAILPPPTSLSCDNIPSTNLPGFWIPCGRATSNVWKSQEKFTSTIWEAPSILSLSSACIPHSYKRTSLGTPIQSTIGRRSRSFSSHRCLTNPTQRPAECRLCARGSRERTCILSRSSGIHSGFHRQRHGRAEARWRILPVFEERNIRARSRLSQ